MAVCIGSLNCRHWWAGEWARCATRNLRFRVLSRYAFHVRVARLVRSGRQYHQAVCFVPARWLIRMQWDAGSFVCVWEKSRCCRFSSFCLSRRWSWRQAGSPWNCSDCCSRAFPIRLAVFRVFIGILFIGCFVLIWLIILVWQDFKVVCDDCPKCHCEDEIPVGGTFLEFFKVVSDDEA